MEIENALKQYGFDAKEVEIYLCLIKHIELSVFEVAKKTGIARTTVYSKLESLLKQGIIARSKKNGVIHYTPENPKQLIQILKEKEEKITRILPELSKIIDSHGENVTTEVYTGEAGFKRVFEDVIITLEKEHIPILYAISQIDIMQAFPRFMPNWIARRHAISRTFTYMMVPEAAKEDMPDIFNSNKSRETRFFPKEFPFDCTIEIYGNKTAIVSLRDSEYYSIIIDSASVTNTFKQLFLFAWNTVGGKQD